MLFIWMSTAIKSDSFSLAYKKNTEPEDLKEDWVGSIVFLPCVGWRRGADADESGTVRSRCYLTGIWVYKLIIGAKRPPLVLSKQWSSLVLQVLRRHTPAFP